MQRRFRTPEEAEAAFYDAIERADMGLLEDVWAADESIVCIHAGSARLEGREDVLESFSEMFAEAPAIAFTLTDSVHTGNEHLAIHQVREEVQIDGQLISIMLATNVFLRDRSGWHMLMHHASHEPDLHFDEGFDEFDFDDFEDEHEAPPVLH